MSVLLLVALSATKALQSHHLLLRIPMAMDMQCETKAHSPKHVSRKGTGTLHHHPKGIVSGMAEGVRLREANHLAHGML